MSQFGHILLLLSILVINFSWSEPTGSDGQLQGSDSESAQVNSIATEILDQEHKNILAPMELIQTTGSSDTETQSDLKTTTTSPITTVTNSLRVLTTTEINTELPPTTTRDPCIGLYCLNGGFCVLNEAGQPFCRCLEEFYGEHCETRDICKTLIADGLKGDEICATIGEKCIRYQKYLHLRCTCPPDEYFVFRRIRDTGEKTAANTAGVKSKNHRKGMSTSIPLFSQSSGSNVRSTVSAPSVIPFDFGSITGDQFTTSFSTVNEPPSSSNGKAGESDESESAPQQQSTFVAECRKIDQCLGVRCRQMSEVCQNGNCECNQEFGYIRDPSDRLCKLLDACQIPRKDGKPVCGQAQCIPTFGMGLVRCVCPQGLRALRTGNDHGTTRCVAFSASICGSPLLNNCQHLCTIDGTRPKGYWCSCLAGYKQGTRMGVDDHMCFFDEQLGIPAEQYGDIHQFRERRDALNLDHEQPREQLYYQSYEVVNRPVVSGTNLAGWINNDTVQERVIKRQFRRSTSSEVSQRISEPELVHDQTSQSHQTNDENMINALTRMSAQERCSMFCEENEICQLEQGSSDTYRCVCERMGYTRINGRCMDWCAAHHFGRMPEQMCISGECRISSKSSRPEWNDHLSDWEKLERESSWRPTFECDCSTSPVLVMDPETGLCRIDFRRLIEPCLPGNVGHIDCVENKNAFCSVLHLSETQFWKSLVSLRAYPWLVEQISGEFSAGHSKSSSNIHSHHNNANRLNIPAYTCVCSPEKKFLFDKPRNKARCVDECDLLETECGRFNRMCRPATMLPSDRGQRNLIKLEREAAIMDFRRTGCECLPGFNVKPTERVDVTVDDNIGGGGASGGVGGNGDVIQPLGDDFPTSISGETFSFLDGLEGQDQASKVRYININSRCLLDYDVVHYYATFKAPADLDPAWLMMRNAKPGRPVIPAPDKSSQPVPTILQQTATPGIQSQSSAYAKSSHGPPYLSEFDQKSRSAETNHPDHNVPIFKEKGIARTCCFEDGLGVAARKEDQKEHSPGAPKVTSWLTEKQTNVNMDPDVKVQGNDSSVCNDEFPGSCVLEVPDWYLADVDDLHRYVVFIGSNCETLLSFHSPEAYKWCVRYRYWIVRKLRHHFVDWRVILQNYLSSTFDLLDGTVGVHIDRCEASINSVEHLEKDQTGTLAEKVIVRYPQVVNDQISGDKMELDTSNPTLRVDADIHCELTLHSASGASVPGPPKKIMLEKQLPKYIFNEFSENFGTNYYLMAPSTLIHRDSSEQLARRRKLFDPCHSSYGYCDKQTKCEMIDSVNFTCTCQYGYTPIGSRDISYKDSRKEVCEDIDECLFDVCRDLASVSVCINEIGDYRCQCNRHYTGDNKRYCTHVCNTIPCKHGKCRLVADHHAFCECEEGYKEADCSVQDQNAALRKANMIILGSIFTSVLLLAITLAYSLNSQLRKAKKKLKRLESISDAAQLFQYSHQQTPFRSRLSKANT